MTLKTVVISLGGSRIIPNEVDYEFLREFKTLISKHKNTKFVVVTGGGTTARKYIDAYKKMHKSTYRQSRLGIAITRFHAFFMMDYFGKPANEVHPHSLHKIKNLLNKNHVVFCGALRHSIKPQTSDATSAQIASYLKCPFINVTNIKGIYTDNPKTNPKAKFIKQISWEDFNEMAKKIKFSAGQHFVLDQRASQIISKNKTPTYIVKSLTDISKIVLEKKNISGSLISGKNNYIN